MEWVNIDFGLVAEEAMVDDGDSVMRPDWRLLSIGFFFNYVDQS